MITLKTKFFFVLINLIKSLKILYISGNFEPTKKADHILKMEGLFFG